jgi:hypothetical protein
MPMRFITKLILLSALLVVLSQLPIVYADKVLIIDMDVMKSDNAVLNDLVVRYGREEKNIAFEGTHKLQIVGLDGNVLYTKDLGITFTVYAHSFGHDIAFEYDNTTIYIRIPYNPDFHFLKLYKGDKLIFEENIAIILCNYDGICSGSENYLSCTDCGDNSKDGFCDIKKDGVCDGDCIEQKDPDCFSIPKREPVPPNRDSLSNEEHKNEQSSKIDNSTNEEKGDGGETVILWSIITIIAPLLIGLIIFFMRRHEKQKELNDLINRYKLHGCDNDRIAMILESKGYDKEEAGKALEKNGLS